MKLKSAVLCVLELFAAPPVATFSASHAWLKTLPQPLPQPNRNPFTDHAANRAFLRGKNYRGPVKRKYGIARGH